MSKNEDYGFDTEFMTDEEVEQMLTLSSHPLAMRLLTIIAGLRL